ncbi:MAG TPA: LON peptidase substrate-binding domain-containing protein [Acidobacteriota bacterium]|nr:LON peptidase substrate-binding domain-containing protein [Acidobacteriota bacterium]HND18297.1 LON peptidase substrate-binding domain-containing protein [Acidobacteriota bacterium]
MSIPPIPSLEGSRTLPLFPLPLVLFPGAILPLHIFEPRYKEMIKDCLDGDRLFGITFLDSKEGWPPPTGRIGCAAFILATVPLQEGRMNLLTTGVMRYRTLEYIETRSYLQAQVEFFQDAATDLNLAELADQVTTLYRRTIRATQVIQNNDLTEDELPDDPEELSFSIASTLQLSTAHRLELLELTSVQARLERLKKMLQGVVGQYELRATVHEKAKTNGHGSHKTLAQLLEEERT